MKKIFLFFIFTLRAAASDFAPLAVSPPTTVGPGVPTFLQVGTLSCAARMYTPVQLQVWCSTLKAIQMNVIVDISDKGFETSVSDSNNYDTGTSINWLFLVDIVPFPPKVSWRAYITKNTVMGPMLSGFLQ